MWKYDLFMCDCCYQITLKRLNRIERFVFIYILYILFCREIDLKPDRSSNNFYKLTHRLIVICFLNIHYRNIWVITAITPFFTGWLHRDWNSSLSKLWLLIASLPRPSGWDGANNGSVSSGVDTSIHIRLLIIGLINCDYVFMCSVANIV